VRRGQWCGPDERSGSPGSPRSRNRVHPAWAHRRETPSSLSTWARAGRHRSLGRRGDADHGRSDGR
jgi:hypothetical protein